MVAIPRATTTVRDQAGAAATGLDVVCIWTPAAVNADAVPRIFGSAAAVYAFHGYCEGVEYASLHAERTRKPFLVCALPIATAGVVGRENKTGNTGSSVSTVAAGGSGVLAEHEGVAKVDHPSGTTITVGTDQVKLLISLDGGRTFKSVRLGTATSYAIPHFGVTISFTVGTLKGGETIHTWFGSAPRSDSAGWLAARTALAAQQKGFRSVLLCGDLQNSTEANAYVGQINLYETANERFVYGRASVRDRLPLAAMSLSPVRVVGSPSLTFAEVGASSDTCTRAAGSFLTDGFAALDFVTFSNTVSNNVSGQIAALSPTVLTMGTTDLNPETLTTAVVVAYHGLTFTATTMARSRGSWIADGFRLGDSYTVAGTVSNNGTKVITGITDTTITFASGGVAESVSSQSVTVTTGQTIAAWAADLDASFAAVDDKPRLDMSLGRGRVSSSFSGWYLRRPAAWAASLREYQHDLHIATWRKSDGPVDFDLFDAAGNRVEYDDRVDGGAASAARFTSLRTWANGPAGGFVSLSLTRASEGSLRGMTHNEAVIDLACTTVQLNTENAAIGVSLILNDDGTATTASLDAIKAQVDKALEQALLVNKLGEGPRASAAEWNPDRTTLFNVPTPVLTGVTDLLLHGTVHSVASSVVVQTGA
jgi:hypothetical protein